MAGNVFGVASVWIRHDLGWLYILGATTFLAFLIWIALSRYGRVRLGPPDSGPEHGFVAWFAMLFAAMMGAVLVLWSVAEPLTHYFEPPRHDISPQSVAAAEEAMGYALYHFGLHSWAISCLPALAVAYVGYRRGLPLRMSSVLHPLLGNRCYGPIGRSVDVLAAVCMVFTVAIFVGLGTSRINRGLSDLFGIAVGNAVQLSIVGMVGVVAMIMVVSGQGRGLGRISKITMGLAVALLLMVFVLGSPFDQAKGITETIGTYLNQLVPLSFWNDAYADTGWQSNWTVLYRSLMIAWSPLIGLFIARISKGRTIREFVFGVVALPTAFSIVWFGVFGRSAIDLQHKGEIDLSQELTVAGDVPGMLFTFLDAFPMGAFLVALAVLVVVLFLGTTVGASSVAVDMCRAATVDGTVRTRQRAFWVVAIIGLVVACVTVIGNGGFLALQDVVVVIGLPFLPIGFLTMYALVRALRTDIANQPPLAPTVPTRHTVRKEPQKC